LINDLPKGCPRQLQSILADCWQWSPEKRPEMQAILEQLKHVQIEPADQTNYNTLPSRM
jgi:hypothetical protein